MVGKSVQLIDKIDLQGEWNLGHSIYGNKHNNCKSFNREIKVYSTVALQTTNYCNASLVLVNTIIGLRGELLSFSNNIYLFYTFLVLLFTVLYQVVCNKVHCTVVSKNEYNCSGFQWGRY